MEGNSYIYFIAALIPMIIGFIWYNPKVFGNAWMKAAKVTQGDIEGGNMPLIFGLSYLFSLMLAGILNYLVHHDMQILGTILMDPELGVSETSELGVLAMDFAEQIKVRYSSFPHGMVHGMMMAVFVVLPVFATNAMFERKSFKYVLVNWAYWAVTFMVMGGVLCEFY